MPKTGSIRERLLHRGNIACPLCLSVFGDGDSQPTVEHIPPKGMGGRPMCLICESCRTHTSRTDPAKINVSRRGGPRLSAYIDGHRQYGAVSMDGAGNIGLAPHRPLPEIQTGSRLTLKFKLKELLDVSASDLRVAYLTVFSLLGPWGYLFAQSATGVALRRHILNAERKAVVRIAGEIPPGHVALFDEPAFCWGVGSDHNSAILIPRHHEADLAAQYDDGDRAMLSGWSVPYGEFGCRQSCAIDKIPSREIRGQQLRLTVGAPDGREHIFDGLLAGFVGADYTIMIGDLACVPTPSNAKEIAKIALDYPQLPAGQLRVNGSIITKS